MDWKEALLAQSKEMGIAPEETDEPRAEETATDTLDPAKHAPLHVVVERKGRGGKTATIIEGFACGDDALKEVATRLKKALGTGGSARGGEILIQGDRRQDVIRELRDMGFRLKG